MSSGEHDAAADRPTMGPITREESAREWKKTAEDILKTLPPPSMKPLPKDDASDLAKYKNQLGISTAEAWKKCAEAMRKYDADSCKAYREEIDTLLVFAGLFSAVVTAFTVESYKWLQVDPNDVIIALLSRIAHLDDETLPSTGLPHSVSVRINTYWFLSLALGLLAALLAILCKQWVREFERDAHQSHEQFISIRQMKLEGFASWGVGSIVAAIPLLLQSALALFALGVAELLWNMDSFVATIASIPAVGGLVFYAFTTLIPAIQVATTLMPALQVVGGLDRLRSLAQCPFKSPQATLTVVILLSIPGNILEFYRLFVEPLLHLLYKTVICFLFYRQDRTSPNQTRERSFRGFRGWFLRVKHVFSFDLLLRMFRDMDPWLRSDLEFTRLRDAAYSPMEYQQIVQKNWTMPPSLRFSALKWLLLHVDQPGMRTWTWLCIWDMATKVHESHPLRELNALRVQHGTNVDDLEGDQSRQFNTHRFQREILSMVAIFSAERSTLSEPCAMALRYGLHAHLEPRFFSEAFIHLLPTLDISLARDIYRWIMHKLGNDDEYMKSVVSAILALPTWTPATEEGGDTRDLRPLLVSVGSEASRSYPRSVSQPQRACAVALYFRELRTHNVPLMDARKDLQDLLLAAIARFVDGQSNDPGASPTADERAVFSALARAVDQCFDRLGDPTTRDRFAAARLAQPLDRRVYLDLLSEYPDEDAAARERRFERNIAPLAREYAAQNRSPEVVASHGDLAPAPVSGSDGPGAGQVQIIVTDRERERPLSAGVDAARATSVAPADPQASDSGDGRLHVPGPP